MVFMIQIPWNNPDAIMYDEVPFMAVLNKNLNVMDATAITLCMGNKLPLIVFNLTQAGNLKHIVQGKKIGTLVTQNPTQP